MQFKANKKDKKPSSTQLMEAVTAQLVELMEKEGSDWTKPFTSRSSLPANALTGKNYSGTNVMLLMMGTDDSEFAGYKQWTELGAQVRKGEQGHAIVRPHIAKDKKDPEKMFITGFGITYVWGRSQVDNAPVREEIEQADITERLENADAFFKAVGASVFHNEGGRAYYQPSSDSITMPTRESFIDTDTSTATESYYSTLAHEHIHWTGSSKRLDRLKASAFGDDLYAFEELIAEIGAAMLSVKLGISSEPRPDHAKYLNGWIRNLKKDPEALFKAASKSLKAVEFLDNFQQIEEAVAA